MLIISQDRKNIVNLENIVEIHVGVLIIGEKNKSFDISYDGNSGNSLFNILGNYATEERAKEVLQEIYTSYANMEMLKLYNIQIGQVITSEDMFKAICYQMPKE